MNQYAILIYMKTNINFNKILYGILLVVALVLIVPAINYISVALGFNGPTQAPPDGSGAITAGPGPAFNVGINTALPTTAKLAITSPGLPAIDTDPTPDGAVGTGIGTAGRIIGLATNVVQFNLMNGDDAASKAYVDAQGGGGKPVITVWGISATPAAWSQFTFTTTKNYFNCLFGTGDSCNTATMSFPAAGFGVSCPAGYTSILPGYGPYAYLSRAYYFAGPTASDSFQSRNGGGQHASDDNVPSLANRFPHQYLSDRQLGVTYSICGAAPYQVAQLDYTILDNNGQQGTGIGATAGILSACAVQSGVAVCNTCQVCQQN